MLAHRLSKRGEEKILIHSRRDLSGYGPASLKFFFLLSIANHFVFFHAFGENKPVYSTNAAAASFFSRSEKLPSALSFFFFSGWNHSWLGAFSSSSADAYPLGWIAIRCRALTKFDGIFLFGAREMGASFQWKILNSMLFLWWIWRCNAEFTAFSAEIHLNCWVSMFRLNDCRELSFWCSVRKFETLWNYYFIEYSVLASSNYRLDFFWELGEHKASVKC